MSYELWLYLDINDMKLSQHPLGPKLGHKSVPKAVKCSTRRQYKSMETVNKFQRFRSNWSSMCKDSKTGSIKLSRLTDNRHSLQAEISQQKNESRLTRARCDEARAKYNRPLSKTLLTESHRTNHLKWAQDHEAMNWNQVFLFRRDNYLSKLRQRIGLELTGKKRLCELSSASNQSQCFGVASQVKVLVASSVLNKIEMQN